jgi:cell shape-determining protein MreC
VALLITFRGAISYFLTPIASVFSRSFLQAREIWVLPFESIQQVNLSKGELIAENMQLRGNLISSQLLQARLQELENENSTLQQSLGYIKLNNVKLGYVLSTLQSSPYDTFTIDIGSAQEVGVGDIVSSLDHELLGKIIEVYPDVSKVELFSAPGAELELLLDNKSRVIAHGEGSQNFTIDLPQGLKIEEGSTLYWPGPHNFVLAIVETIHSDVGDAFIRAYARNPTNIHTIRRVYVW